MEEAMIGYSAELLEAKPVVLAPALRSSLLLLTFVRADLVLSSLGISIRRQ